MGPEYIGRGGGCAKQQKAGGEAGEAAAEEAADAGQRAVEVRPEAHTRIDLVRLVAEHERGAQEVEDARLALCLTERLVDRRSTLHTMRHLAFRC